MKYVNLNEMYEIFRCKKNALNKHTKQMNLLTVKCLYISSKLKEKNKQLYYIYPLFFLFPLPLGLSEKDLSKH